MAIKDLLKDVFDSDETFDIQEAIQRIQRKKGSISSALSRGVKTDDFKRIERGIYQTIDKWYKKTIGTIYYCGGVEWIYTAWTFEENNDDQKEWLRGQLESFLDDNCSDERKFLGYESKTVTDKEAELNINAIFNLFDYSRTKAK